MNETAIGWTDYTWNLFSGCKEISPECAHCYAKHLSEQHRRGAEAKGKTSAAFPHGFDLTVRPHKLDEPHKLLRAKGPSLIFCESMSDIGLDDGELSEEETARLRSAGYSDLDGLREDFFDVIDETPEHRYQVLTKRPETLLEYFKARSRPVPPNVWIGVTIGHPRSLDRLDVLRKFRDLDARVLFISAEPLLADLTLEAVTASGLRRLDLNGIDWLIVGGESGNHFGPKWAERFLVTGDRGRYFPSMSRDTCGWVRGLRDAAHAAGTAFFFKQWGGVKPTSAGRTLDGRTWDELPTVPGALPKRRVALGAATAGLARKLPVV